jgi:hypothetical protein
MPDSWDIPKQKELNMAEEKRGIEETKDILDFMFSFVEAVGKAKKDGEMSWSDARFFIDPVKKLFEAVDDIEDVLPEIEDLSEEEYDQLVEYVKDKWDYNEENLDWVVDTAIEAGKSILMLVNLQKS